MPKVTVNLPTRTLVAGGACAPCEARRLNAQADEVVTTPVGETPEPAAAADARWSGVLCVEGKPTGDGRLMSPGSLRWDSLPMPLRWDIEDDGAHAGAVVVGTIDTVERNAKGEIVASGMIDGEGPAGREAIRLMKKGMLKGVSVDLDDMDVEIRVKAELMMPPVDAEPVEDDEDEPVEEEDAEAGAKDKAPEADEDGRVTVYEGSTDDEMMVVLDARIRGATLVDIPAFAEAYLTLDGDAPMPADEDEDELPVEELALLASAIPVDPPAAWFADPKLSEPTPLTFTDDGRVYGHIATWGTCHTGYRGRCVTPPRSASGYAWFLTGEVVTAEGQHLPVGRLTFDTQHAHRHASPAAAAAHYDNTGRCGADLAIGEDSHGIWVAGAVRPGITPADLRTLRGAPYSGDWRERGAGQMELIGILGVNIPGFPVPRAPRALVASGRVATLLLPISSRRGEAPVEEVEALPKPGPSATLRAKMLAHRMRGAR